MARSHFAIGLTAALCLAAGFSNAQSLSEPAAQLAQWSQAAQAAPKAIAPGASDWPAPASAQADPHAAAPQPANPVTAVALVKETVKANAVAVPASIQPAAAAAAGAQAAAVAPAQAAAVAPAQPSAVASLDPSPPPAPETQPSGADSPAADLQTMPGAESTAPPLPASGAGADALPPPAGAGGAPAAASNQGDLWERIRKGFAMPDLTNTKSVTSTRWYAAQPDYIARMTSRASLYLYYIVQEIERRGLPTELALLPFVESAMQPQAVSAAQAAGLWQFIPSTGKMYLLEQNLWKDERFGVVESTRAALDYLEKLHNEFGNWQLALAAYNYGEAGVERALAYNRSRHRPLNYENLRLPRETQFYVPKLQAIKNIIENPARYGIELPQIVDQPYFVTVSGARDMDVATAARLADMPIEDFQALNPAYNRPLIVGAMAPTILLPADRADKFSANLAAWEATGQPLASWAAYRLKTGESLSAVARRVGVSEAALRSANHVPPRYVLASGSTVLIPRDETMEDVSGDMLDGSMALVPERAGLRKVTVRVRRGDTLASIARRWHVTADEVMAWNDLRTGTLFAGQHLNLTVASAASGPRKGHRRTHGNHPTTLARANTATSAR